MLELTLPDGAFTDDLDTHAEEWYKYITPLLDDFELTWVGIGGTPTFDFIQVEYKGITHGLSKEFIVNIMEKMYGE